MGHAAAAIIALASSAAVLTLTLVFAVTGGEAPQLAGAMTSGSVAASGSVNVVTTILLDFRSLDTLGEASVIFASVACVGVLFRGSRRIGTEPGLGVLVRRSVGYLSALFLLFPLYIVAHGHLSPGGGFQGGVSLAVLLILLTVAYGSRPMATAVDPSRLHMTESLSALGFLMAGFVGVLQGTSFLANAAAGFPRGVPGSLLSGGLIPVLNAIIGVKVASGLGSIFFDFQSERGE